MEEFPPDIYARGKFIKNSMSALAKIMGFWTSDNHQFMTLQLALFGILGENLQRLSTFLFCCSSLHVDSVIKVVTTCLYNYQANHDTIDSD